MSQTVYAAFADAARAESAASALLDRGIPAADLSLVVNEGTKERSEAYADAPALGSQPTIVSGPAGATGRFDPLGNDVRSTPPIQGGNLFPVRETAEISEDLNPAQNDYPRTGSDSPTELSSRPPESKYDWNPDLDRKSYNADYKHPDGEAVDAEIRREGDRDRERNDPASGREEIGLDATDGNHGMVALQNNSTLADSTPSGDASTAVNGATARTAQTMEKAGVHVTTVADAAKGAARGVSIGLGVGALAAVASIAVPGVGLILGGGALAATVAGLAASVGHEAVAGGIVAYLKDQGVPADSIQRFQEIYEAGGSILSVKLESDGAAPVEAILNGSGATAVSTAKGA